MLTKLALTAVALAAAGVVAAQQAPAQQATAEQTAAQKGAAQQPQAQQAPAHQAGSSPKDPKSMSGMSILGNQDAPKSLVIVPWKSSEIGNGIGVSRALDTSIRAVDRDVFMRELKYYGIRSGTEK
ncbi:MAG TPA: hypothetical protein VF405_16650 [Gammaproteobacteria bacterium]